MLPSLGLRQNKAHVRPLFLSLLEEGGREEKKNATNTVSVQLIGKPRFYVKKFDHDQQNPESRREDVRIDPL